MQIARIELFGFKSFMDRTVLPLSGGITGVVGPNGCGKSNVVDATRWVLGETRAKSLRGDLLEDVIFNGTDKLRPLGLAEVSMTLRSEGKDFFSDLFSSPSSIDLTSLSELSEEIVLDETIQLGNGNVSFEANGELVQVQEKNSTKDERLDLEAGLIAVSDSSAILMQKYGWLRSVNEVQITRRLYRSGESEFFLNRVPCRLKDLREFCRAIGMGPRAYTIVAQGEITRIVTAKAEERRAILEEAAGVQGFRDKIVAAQRRLEDTDLNISRLDDIIKEVTKQVAILKRQAAKAHSRQQLKNELMRLECLIYKDKLALFANEQREINTEWQNAGEEEAELSSCLSERQSIEEEIRSELMSIDVSGDELRAEIDEIKGQLAARDRARGERLAKIGELKALISGTEGELKNLVEQKARLERKKKECEQEIDSLMAENTALCEKKDAIENKIQLEDSNNIAESLEIKRRICRDKEVFLRESRDEVVALKTLVSSLREQLIDDSPLESLKEKLLAHGNQIEIQENLVAEVIHVPDNLIKTVQVVLQERASYLVADDPHQLMLDIGEVAFGVGLIKKCPQGKVEIGVVSGLKALIDCIEVEDGYRQLIAVLLSGIYLTPSLDNAYTYFKNNCDSDLVLVTNEGDLVTKDSYYKLSGEGGIIQIRNKIEGTEQKLRLSEERYEVIDNECFALRKEIEQLEQKQVLALAESNRIREQFLQLSTLQGQIAGRLDGLVKVRENLAEELVSCDEQHLDADTRLDALQYRLDSAEEEMASEEEQQDASLEDELASKVMDYDSLERRRQEKRLRMNEVIRVVEDLRQQVDALRIKGAGLELRKQKIALSHESLKEKVISEYGDDVWQSVCAGVEEPLEDFMRREYEQEIAKMKLRIVREGEVDPESITRLEEENKRLEQLEQQKSDLEKASRILKRTIARLIETSIARFMATFEAVRRDFERLIPQLFNGGKGTLELNDPTNPLETGLELSVRPPGKKLKSIELLSGGEKGLCAAALIFSMFLQRPSPLCLLDEVDAPFDEVNLSRFISLIKEMSSHTQFLMITHNKQAMAACDNLVGVTMQEPGASKILTVSLENAYEQVA